MDTTNSAPVADDGGLTMMIDPRWIVAVPGNDVEAEVRRQMIDRPPTETDESWEQLTVGTAGMLAAALEGGVAWTGICLLREADGSLLLVRALLEFRSAADQPDAVTVETLRDELLVAHRDDSYASTIDVVSTWLAPAVRHHQVIELDETHLGELRSYYLPLGPTVVAVQAIAAGVGRAEQWGQMLEAMVTSLRRDPSVPAEAVRMLVAVAPVAP